MLEREQECAGRKDGENVLGLKPQKGANFNCGSTPLCLNFCLKTNSRVVTCPTAFLLRILLAYLFQLSVLVSNSPHFKM